MESTASDMVEIGVLNSWVILLIKSDLIILSFFCFNIVYIVMVNVAMINSVSNNDPNNNHDIELISDMFLEGKDAAVVVKFSNSNSGRRAKGNKPIWLDSSISRTKS